MTGPGGNTRFVYVAARQAGKTMDAKKKMILADQRRREARIAYVTQALGYTPLRGDLETGIKAELVRRLGLDDPRDLKAFSQWRLTGKTAVGRRSREGWYRGELDGLVPGSVMVCAIHYRLGVPHRDDGPAVVFLDGSWRVYREGRKLAEGGP